MCYQKTWRSEVSDLEALREFAAVFGLRGLGLCVSGALLPFRKISFYGGLIVV
jgi:hypothetical protein